MSRVPPHSSAAPPASAPAGAEDLEELEELGDDAIIAQQQGAHVPKPRVHVTEEARSIVISEHPAPGSHPPSAPKIPKDLGRRRSERTEKTVVIRDRRQVEELRRQMTQRQGRARPAPPTSKGIVLWVIVGVAAFLAGGLAALLATRDESATSEQSAPAPSSVPAPKAAPTTTTEPPSVSIDELPIERK